MYKRQGYIRKILPLKSRVTISGKISFYKNKYQITNPTHVSTDINKIKKIHSSYSLTEGLSEKKYLTIVNTVLEKLPDLRSSFTFLSVKVGRALFLTNAR